MINLYQKDDSRPINPIRFWGDPVRRADENILVSYKNDEIMRQNGRYNHNHILRSNILNTVIQCELDLLVKQRKKCSYEHFKIDAP